MAARGAKVVKGSKALIGMVHVGALPGTPNARLGLEALRKQAVADSVALHEAGFDAIVLENMHDAPYVHGRKGAETVVWMSLVGEAVKREMDTRGFGGPLGVQVLSGGNQEAMAIAMALNVEGRGRELGRSGEKGNATKGKVTGSRLAGLGGFIRCENFVFSHVADEGLLMKAEAGELLRYRKAIGADGSGPDRCGVSVFCDIKKKHASHAMTADVSIGEAGAAAEFFGADGVIVTGVATGRPTDVRDVEEASGATRLPVLVGSGVSPEDAPRLLECADALIVGSWVKRGGDWRNAVDAKRAAQFVREVRKSVR